MREDMVDVLEHPLVQATRQYAHDARRAATTPKLRPRVNSRRLDLLRALGEIRTGVAELERASVEVTTLDEIRRESMRAYLARLLNQQIALWQALGFLPAESPLTSDVRTAMLHTMREVEEVMEAVVFKVDTQLSAALQARLASLTPSPEGDWRDVLAAL